jgi:hypothetical protein
MHIRPFRLWFNAGAILARIMSATWRAGRISQTPGTTAWREGFFAGVALPALPSGGVFAHIRRDALEVDS